MKRIIYGSYSNTLRSRIDIENIRMSNYNEADILQISSVVVT